MWVDACMKRPDLKAAGKQEECEWNAVDATPQEESDGAYVTLIAYTIHYMIYKACKTIYYIKEVDYITVLKFFVFHILTQRPPPTLSPSRFPPSPHI